MSHIYKTGDKVRVLKSDWPEIYPVGSAQTVTDFYTITGGVFLNSDGELAQRDEQHYFRADEIEPFRHIYKVGDVVCIVANNTAHGFQMGETVTVKSLRPDGSPRLARNEQDAVWYINDCDCRPVAEEACAERIQPVYKVGDMVRIVATDWPEEFPVGAVKRIISIASYREKIRLEGQSSDFGMFFWPQELEPFVEIRPTLEDILAAVGAEVGRAEANWPPMNSAHEAYGVLTEEYRELETHVFTNQKRRDLAAMRAEAVQVAAMAVRFIRDVCDGGRRRV